MERVRLSEKMALIPEPYLPKVVGELNGQWVKLVRFDGPYVWHSHEHEDEMFYVVEGRIRIELRDRTEALDAGDFLIVPRGVEHRPVADEPAYVMLFEPKTTVNTGEVDHDYTKRPDELERI
jgi:mannose-6-phosphate isomerase-like protein (cupin superfamily)